MKEKLDAVSDELKKAEVDIVKLIVERNGHQRIHISDKYQVVSIEPASSRTILIKVKKKNKDVENDKD